MKRHNGTMKRNHICSQCDRTFYEKNKLDQHMLTHTGLVSINLMMIFEINLMFNSFRNHTNVNIATELTLAKVKSIFTS